MDSWYSLRCSLKGKTLYFKSWLNILFGLFLAARCSFFSTSSFLHNIVCWIWYSSSLSIQRRFQTSTSTTYNVRTYYNFSITSSNHRSRTLYSRKRATFAPIAVLPERIRKLAWVLMVLKNFIWSLPTTSTTPISLARRYYHSCSHSLIR